MLGHQLRLVVLVQHSKFQIQKAWFRGEINFGLLEDVFSRFDNQFDKVQSKQVDMLFGV